MINSTLVANDVYVIEEQIEQAVLKAQQGDRTNVELLLLHFQSLVKCKTRSYFLAGADREDLLQEGMIGLYKAIRDFDPSKQIPFPTFADLCITRQLITAIKSSLRLKHKPLNQYLSIYRPTGEEDSDRTLLDTLCSPPGQTPEDKLLSTEAEAEWKGRLAQQLSEFEMDVLMLYLSDASYKEIADSTQTTTKAVDNALCRVKRKLSQCDLFSTSNAV
ncbi:MAG: hypothetical protein JWN30_115 [Bacilli bacterium]|nr:hypothetical protein [Bacilli bacterium]